MTPEEKQAKVDEQKKIHEAVITGKGLELLPPNVRRTVDNPEFQSILMSDPAKLMPQVRQPLLIVQGGLDTQVEPQNADLLEGLARKRKNAPAVEIVKVPGVNHLLVPATTGEVSEYADLKDKHVSAAVTERDRHVAEQDALGRALEIARGYAASRAEPAGAGRRDAARAARGARRSAARDTDRSHRRHRRAGASGGAGSGHDDWSAILRLRDRRRAAGDGRGGMARRGLGSAGEPLRALPRGGRRRRSGGRVADRSARAAAPAAASAS